MQHCRSLSRVIISRLSTKDKTSRVANTMIRLWGCEAAGAPARLLALAHFALLCFAWQHFVLRELQLQHLQHCTHKEPELQPLFPRAAATWSPPPQLPNSHNPSCNTRCPLPLCSITIFFIPSIHKHHKCLLQCLNSILCLQHTHCVLLKF